MLRCDSHNWWPPEWEREGKKGLTTIWDRPLRVWPCSCEDIGNTNQIWFSFLFYFSIFKFIFIFRGSQGEVDTEGLGSDCDQDSWCEIFKELIKTLCSKPKPKWTKNSWRWCWGYNYLLLFWKARIQFLTPTFGICTHIAFTHEHTISIMHTHTHTLTKTGRGRKLEEVWKEQKRVLRREYGQSIW